MRVLTHTLVSTSAGDAEAIEHLLHLRRVGAPEAAGFITTFVRDDWSVVYLITQDLMDFLARVDYYAHRDDEPVNDADLADLAASLR